MDGIIGADAYICAATLLRPARRGRETTHQASGQYFALIGPPLMHHPQDARAYSLSILLVMVSRCLVVLALLALRPPELHATLTRTEPDWRAATHLLIERSEDDEAVLFINSRQLVEHYWDAAGRPRPVPVSLSSPAECGDLRRIHDVDVRRAIAVLDTVDGAWVVQRYRNSHAAERHLLSEIERRWPERSSSSFHNGAINSTRYGDR